MKAGRMESVLCALLADSIRGRRPPAPTLSPEDWVRLMDAALGRDLLALLYPALAGWPPGTLPATLSARWRLLAMQAAIQEARRFREALEITHAFAGHGFPCVAFKGMVLRALYPSPDLRTMGDVDLLLRPGDLPAAEALLQEQGLVRMVNTNPRHHTWRSGPGLFFELHTTLLKESDGTMEAAFFAGASRQEADGRTFYAPPPEEAACYQVLHMADHFRYLGFGLRELADLTLELETGLSIPRLLAQLDAVGAGIFGRAVLLAAHHQLGLSLPPGAVEAWAIPPETVARLTASIMDAGIHGRHNIEGALYLNADRRDGRDAKSSPLARRLDLMGWILFPNPSELGLPYAYARSRPRLLPLAWVHRLIRTVVLSPALAGAIFRFGSRYLLTGNRRRRLQADLGLLPP